MVNAEDLAVVSVLSGNRNFEGRINPDVKMNYLASPPLCVAYALAGTMDIDLLDEPLGQDYDGEDVYLKDIWPTAEEVARTVEEAVQSDMFTSSYGEVFAGDERWNSLDVPEGDRFAWADDSTYVRKPPFFEDLPPEPEPVGDIEGARVLAVLGDSVTTDHISPAGAIKKGSPAAQYLNEHGVENKDFNSYGSRRGNHEVMMRGTFANIRLRNFIAGQELVGGLTLKRRRRAADLRRGDEVRRAGARRWSCSRARSTARARRATGRPRARSLLGVRAVIAESFERIHRSNLVGMGVLPLQFNDGESAESLGLTGEEEFSITGHRRRRRQGGHRPGRRQGVHRARADRHPEGGRLLQARRHPASSCCAGCCEGAVTCRARCRSPRRCAGSSPRPAPPATSSRAAAVFREAAAAFAEITYDTVGSSVARVKGTADGPFARRHRPHRRDRPDRPPHRRRRATSGSPASAAGIR